ncbi:hypothetical protein GZH47_33145 (plasmid) [Paenibacillus rhizovicinus]|uniref:Uncharacterized protein n=1 Tax=Paenibacillus rhizovicinus TaxID=2704463 RepID=A0A6C0PBG9_9BACL|nr:hypothetical protein [Paenibacillus rhizovicinus]QHW35741.1 hypothetical protein GZH47_33145 [Paenibacillus rhizovicinus]
MSQEQYGDLFDHMVPGSNREHASSESAQQEAQEVREFNDKLTSGDMVATSYLMVNALLNLLIDKGYIKEDEVSKLIDELWTEFKAKRGRRT